MKNIFRKVVDWIAFTHNEIYDLFERKDWPTDDTFLHFIVFGVCGFILYLLTRLVFTKLAKKNISVISWIYSFTFIAAAAAIIEMAQQITSTGSMEEKDLIYGILGFVCAFIIYTVISTIFIGIYRSVTRRKK